jgi:hypothetical protein
MRLSEAVATSVDAIRAILKAEDACAAPTCLRLR